jgi:hypothetical protein
MPIKVHHPSIGPLVESPFFPISQFWLLQLCFLSYQIAKGLFKFTLPLSILIYIRCLCLSVSVPFLALFLPLRD